MYFYRKRQIVSVNIFILFNLILFQITTNPKLDPKTTHTELVIHVYDDKGGGLLFGKETGWIYGWIYFANEILSDFVFYALFPYH